MGRKNQFEPIGVEKLLKTHQINNVNFKSSDSFECSSEYKVIGELEIKNKLFIISDDDYKILSIGLKNTDPEHWYKINSKKELPDQLNHLISLYNGELPNTQRISGFMGEQDGIKLYNLLSTSHFTDNLVYGSSWKDYPFRGSKQTDILKYVGLRQLKNTYSLSCRTLSNSIVTFKFKNGLVFLNINYPSSISQTVNDNYPSDIPIDVLNLLNELPPFLSLKQLIFTKPVTSDNLFYGLYMADTEQLKYEMLENITELEKTGQLSKEDQSLINNIKNKLKHKLKNQDNDQVETLIQNIKQNDGMSKHLINIIDEQLNLLNTNQQKKFSTRLLTNESEFDE